MSDSRAICGIMLHNADTGEVVQWNVVQKVMFESRDLWIEVGHMDKIKI